ncbi:MAG: DUF2156 domain-containing protein [Deltaproteobacteria bacterium]|nr:DUF2156 domain-containing protein [Deltaproteobacteria bacterium]
MMFKPLVPEDYTVYQPFFKQQTTRLCIYSLPSLIVWSNDIITPYAEVLDDSLIIYIKSRNENEKNHLIMPISPEREYSPAELHQLTVDLDCKQIRFIPEDYAKKYSIKKLKSYFFVYEESEFEDYIYRTDDLAELKGNGYSKKRNLINQFKREYLIKNRITIESITEEKASECIEFLEEWCEEHGCDDTDRKDELACEKQAALNAIQNINMLDMKGILIRVDNVVSAFGIASHLTNNMGVLHFEKAFSSIKGLYQYLDRECARQLFESYTYINKESDMGIPGLAKAKKSYHPVARIKSFKLVAK